MQRRLTLLFAAFAMCVSILVLSGTSTPDAVAQIGCVDASGDFEVSTAIELNAAITCINEGPAPVLGDFQISLLNDIEAASVVPGGAVFEPLQLFPGAALQIEGNGFVLSRSAAAPTSPLPLLLLRAEGEIDIFELGLSLSPGDTSAIDFDGGALRLWAVGIEATDPLSATGIIVGESATELGLRGTSIDGVATGIESDTFTGIRESTIRSTGTDVIGPNSDFTFVDNSTLAGPVGLQIGDSFGEVANSTILGDGLVGTDPNAHVVYRSSIVGSCSAEVVDPEDFQEPPDPPFAAVIDFGTNAGACFDPSHVIDTELSDNGCQVPTPFGCPRTVSLTPDSPALGVGDCSDLFIDQRNVERTPVGPGCDAGAFEFVLVDPPVVVGDADCDTAVTIGDALLIAQFSVGLRELSATCPLADPTRQIYAPAADIDASGQINIGDALLVARCSVGIDTGYC